MSLFEKGFNDYFKSGRIFGSPIIDQDSLCSVSLKMLFRDQVLAKGSGFFWKMQEGPAIVTAWHNLTGLHHTTRQPLSATGGMPDRVRIRYMTSNPKGFQEHEIPLYLDDIMERPRWIVHKEVGSYFDMAALMVNIHGIKEFNHVNERFERLNTYIPPGSELFVVGFPLGVALLDTFPVWKRASLATEMSLPTHGHPKFLVDATGRGGMSGSPVYRIQRGAITLANGLGLGTKKEFIGLYSGRVPIENTRESSELGFVWRPEIVEEFLKNWTLDEKPEPGKGSITLKEHFGTDERTIS